MVLFDIFIVIQPDPTREANAAMMAFENNRKVFIRFQLYSLYWRNTEILIQP